MGYCLKFGLNKLHCTKKWTFPLRISSFFLQCWLLLLIKEWNKFWFSRFWTFDITMICGNLHQNFFVLLRLRKKWFHVYDSNEVFWWKIYRKTLFVYGSFLVTLQAETSNLTVKSLFHNSDSLKFPLQLS